MTFAAAASAAPVAVGLGAAESFGVLAGQGITNTGPTTINGDIGTFPLTTISGTSSMTITGTNHGGDAVTQNAKTDLVTAYNALAGQGPTTPAGADLTGRTLFTGVYNSASTIGLSGAVTLDAQGDPNAVFVFQAGSGLTTASNSVVRLTNGARACNVFWQIGSSAVLGTNSVFVGSILALTSISATTGATIQGRLLARNGSVTLDSNTITRPSCEPVIPPTSDTPEVTPPTTDTPEATPPTTDTPEATPPTTDTPPLVTTPPRGTTTPPVPTTPRSTTPRSTTPRSTTPRTTTPRSTAPNGTRTPQAPSPGNQVPDVPRGSVDTGDGSASRSTHTESCAYDWRFGFQSIRVFGPTISGSWCWS